MARVGQSPAGIFSLRGRYTGYSTQQLTRVLQFFVVAALSWTIASSLFIYPHEISYFNESIGGPRNGGAHLLGSNLDWGKDLKYSKAWLDDNPKGQPIRLAYFGGLQPSDVGCRDVLPAKGSELTTLASPDLAPADVRDENGHSTARASGVQVLSISVTYLFRYSHFDNKC